MLKNSNNFWLAASQPNAINPAKFCKWYNQFSDIAELYAASEKDLLHLGLTAKEIKFLKNPNWAAIERDLNWCEKNNCRIITIVDENYPLLLHEIHDAPLVLYVRGDEEILSLPQLAIVGSRNPTVTGAEIAEEFSRYLAKSGLVITSGLALGIDACSHKGALLFGKTVAVLGTGLNHIYPHAHQKLAEEIIHSGVLISEFPPFESPKAKNFPLRNRIISGLSLGVLIVEAATRSGSLITARTAVEQGREVFAIPGSIRNPLSKGCHQLIRQGAKLVETAEDIMEELGAFLDIYHTHYLKAQPQASQNSNGLKPTNYLDLESNQMILLEKVGYEVTSLDAIIVRSGLTAGEVSSILLELELKGYLKSVSGGYQRNTR